MDTPIVLKQNKIISMKRITSIAFLVVVALSVNAAKPIKINLEKGKIYNQKMTAVQKITQQFQGMSMDVDINIEQTTSFKIVDIKDSVYHAEVSLKNIKTSIKTAMGTMEITSDEATPSNTSNLLLSEISKHPAKATFTKSGRVLEVGFNKTIDESVNAVASLSEAEKTSMKAQFINQFGDEPMKQQLENSFSMYPPTSTQKGEKWSGKLNTKNVIEFTTNFNAEITDSNAESVSIKFDGELETPENAPVAKLNGIDSKYSINGTIGGSLVVDKKTGWIISSTTNQSLKGVLDFQPNPQMPNGMQVPIIITSDITVKQ